MVVVDLFVSMMKVVVLFGFVVLFVYLCKYFEDCDMLCGDVFLFGMFLLFG